MPSTKRVLGKTGLFKAGYGGSTVETPQECHQVRALSLGEV